MNQDLIDAIKKLTVATTKLTIVVQGLLTLEESKKTPLTLEVGSAPLGPRRPDRYDEANARIERINAEQTNPEKLTFEQRLQKLEREQA